MKDCFFQMINFLPALDFFFRWLLSFFFHFDNTLIVGKKEFEFIKKGYNNVNVFDLKTSVKIKNWMGPVIALERKSAEKKFAEKKFVERKSIEKKCVKRINAEG